MKNWKYNELIATYYSAFFSLVDQDNELKQSNDRIIDDFWFYPENENVIPNFISLLTYLKIQMSLYKKVSKTTIELFNKQKELINPELLNEELDLEEIELFNEYLEEMQARIKICEIT